MENKLWETFETYNGIVEPRYNYREEIRQRTLREIEYKGEFRNKILSCKTADAIEDVAYEYSLEMSAKIISESYKKEGDPKAAEERLRNNTELLIEALQYDYNDLQNEYGFSFDAKGLELQIRWYLYDTGDCVDTIINYWKEHRYNYFKVHDIVTSKYYKATGEITKVDRSNNLICVCYSHGIGFRMYPLEETIDNRYIDKV